MERPFIDIHTHHCGPEVGVEKIGVYRLGHDRAPSECAFTAGVHPWDVAKANASVLGFFDEKHPGLIGVGEIGLDFALREANRALQMQWLEKQLAIAERLGLPVVLHCVRAYNEMVAELKKYRLQTIVFHGFTGSPQLAEQLVWHGHCLSFSQFSLQSSRTVEALKSTPVDWIFLETDDDPQACIEELYCRAAVIRKTTLEDLKEAVYANYKRVFHD